MDGLARQWPQVVRSAAIGACAGAAYAALTIARDTVSDPEVRYLPGETPALAAMSAVREVCCEVVADCPTRCTHLTPVVVRTVSTICDAYLRHCETPAAATLTLGTKQLTALGRLRRYIIANGGDVAGLEEPFEKLYTLCDNMVYNMTLDGTMRQP